MGERLCRLKGKKVLELRSEHGREQCCSALELGSAGAATSRLRDAFPVLIAHFLNGPGTATGPRLNPVTSPHRAHADNTAQSDSPISSGEASGWLIEGSPPGDPEREEPEPGN
ncbi:hypothetical protein SKAU_G00080570 [Synaphobranchus kaupii]|uniref:Uncharacterized protein n=1 Tax=Synaphobranchus kaupii TaxID=118154 RepID=A0A9Q1J555_SYNKA|nr:hypothetical protein SKAU_G00080570 [Synaphobranchus kaupii]